MKSINSPNPKADWESQLLNDLSFIKEKKRFPLNKRTLGVSAFAVFFILATARITWIIFLDTQIDNPLVTWLMGSLLVLLMVSIVWRYYRVLKFDAINTGHFVTDNMEIIRKFLKSQNLAFTQHKDAPEVFMIMSRNLNLNSKNEFREIMLFIADDKQVLVNSHFTGNKFSITPPSGNSRKMAAHLKQWLDTHINKGNSTTVTVTGF